MADEFIVYLTPLKQRNAQNFSLRWCEVFDFMRFFFRFALRKTQKIRAPLLRRQSQRGTGRIAMPRHYLYRGHTQIQVIRHYRNGGMPGRRGRRGRRQAFTPKSGNENFVQVIELLVGVTQSPNIIFPSRPPCGFCNSAAAGYPKLSNDNRAYQCTNDPGMMRFYPH